MEPRRYKSTRVHNNLHGYRGVEWLQERGKYRARIEPATAEGRGWWLGSFDTAEEAALAYDEAAREVYGEHAFLNFPGDGEQKTIASPRVLGFCANGHDLSIHGYERPDGRGKNCRKCNLEARHRLLKRKHAETETQ